MQQQKIIILDFGSQTTQLIARRLRELDTFCEILPYNKFPVSDPDVIGVILAGSPYSVYDPEAFRVDLNQFRGRMPILGICYGAQFMSHTLGGKVEPAGSREYGRANLSSIDFENPLFKGFDENSQVWMSHGDTITALPDGFHAIASTEKVKYAAYAADNEPIWGVQFHPEVFHTLQGTQLLRNFVVDICGSRQDWSPANFVETTVAELRQQIGNDRVILGLSGGVDSSVAAVLLNKAIGDRLTCIFVDHGMLRKNEFQNVMKDYECLGLNVIGVDASARFFADLEGVTEPEKKRKIIGRDFIEVFNDEVNKLTSKRVDTETPTDNSSTRQLVNSFLASPGHHLSRPHRKPEHHGQSHQKPPQRRWTAKRNEPEAVRTPEVALQGRSTSCGPSAGHSRAPHRPPSLPRARSCSSHPWSHHAREGSHPARCRRYLHPGAA